MRNLLYLFPTLSFVVTIAVSCNNSPQGVNLEVPKNSNTDTLTAALPLDDEELVEPEEIIWHRDQFKNEFDILIVTEYRDLEQHNAADNLSKSWVDLHLKNGTYHLSKADYSIKRGYSDCSGDSTKIIRSKNKTVLLIDNSHLTLGPIQSVSVTKNKIWPKQKLSFTFENDIYTFRAEGKVNASYSISTDTGEELFQEVENYKIFLKINNGPEQLFVSQESFNDTFMEILFVGDIDRDGKLDFIMRANRDYEEERVLLFLSTNNKDKKGLREVAEIAVQFDC